MLIWVWYSHDLHTKHIHLAFKTEANTAGAGGVSEFSKTIYFTLCGERTYHWWSRESVVSNLRVGFPRNRSRFCSMAKVWDPDSSFLLPSHERISVVMKLTVEKMSSKCMKHWCLKVYKIQIESSVVNFSFAMDKTKSTQLMISLAMEPLAFSSAISVSVCHWYLHIFVDTFCR